MRKEEQVLRLCSIFL